MEIDGTMLEAILAAGRELGFAACGAASLAPSGMAEALGAWLARGRHAGMSWLARTAGVRVDPRSKWTWARGALVGAVSYAGGPSGGPACDSGEDLAVSRARGPSPDAGTAGGSGSPPPPGTPGPPRRAEGGTRNGAEGGILPPPGEGHRRGGASGNAEEGGILPYLARYARGPDYHGVVKARLLAWGERAEEIAGRPLRRVALCDTSAVLERELAVRAGLGWIGKNTCLVGNRGNSWLFLGVLLVDAELPAPDPPGDLLASSRCGNCRACLDACPTGALVEPFVLDARRCLAWLTAEHRGPLPGEFHRALGARLLGCDACQEACPWNRAARLPERPDPELAPLPVLANTTLAEVASLDEEGFRRRFRGTALARAKRAGLVRNALLAGANIGDREVARVAERLLDDPDEGVREAARACLARRRGEGRS